jgi:hypothetical protein
MLVINDLWALPRARRRFGEGSPWNNIATRNVFDHWQISGFAEYDGGAPPSTTPISLRLSNPQNLTGGGDGDGVRQTCDRWHKVPHPTRTVHEWFNTACIEPPIAGSAAPVPPVANPNGVAATEYSTGNGVFAPKVDDFLPGHTNFDTALFKNMPIASKVTLQRRAETDNRFNHTEFNAVNSTATFANFNSQGSSSPQTGATFGQLTGTGNTGSLEGPGVMQVGLRIDF